MADKGKQKDDSTEQDPKNIPTIKILGASGTTESGKKGGLLEKIAHKLHLDAALNRPVKRTKSPSPEPRKDELQMEGESSKNSKQGRLRSSPIRDIADAVVDVFQHIRGDADETKNLCEAAITEHYEAQPVPPEQGMVIDKPPCEEELEEHKILTYKKSSSISSAPSGFSSLPDDDMSPCNSPFPDDDEQKNQ